MSKIINIFNQVCIENKNKCAFYYEEHNKLKQKSFYEVYLDTNNVANYLIKNGVKRGDKILAFASSNYKLCIFIMATFKIGATIMYIDIFARQDKIRTLFNKYQPNYLLVSNKTKYLKVIFGELNKIKNIINIDSIKINNKQEKFNYNIPDSQIALLTTTTGSTGTPKIVIRTQKDLYEQLNLITNNINRCKKDEIILTTSYMYVLANLLQGFTTVLPNINLRKNTKKLNKKLQLYKDIDINMIITSPDFCIKTDNIYPQLEYLYFGGAILNYTEANIIQNKYNQSNNIYMYGCTECNIISKINLNKYIKCLKEKYLNNLGMIVKGVNVNIGQNNEIYVSSEALVNNYIDNDNKQEKHDTSDRGYFLNEELIYLGKNNTILNVNGSIIYSNEIEQNLVITFNLTKCAIVEHNRKFYLFLENRINHETIKKYLQNKFQITVVIKRINKIPCDIKHHTKIDYKKLKRLIK